ANAAEILAINNSVFSVIDGTNVLNRSLETEVEITNNKPAAVERAAAIPPAATNPTTQLGSWAISGAASTMMSLSMTISLVSGSGVYCTTPSWLISLIEIKLVACQLDTHCGTWSTGLSASESSAL